MKEYEKKYTSQFGEDGIIEHIFNTIGTTNKIAVEIGVIGDKVDFPENNTWKLHTKGWNCFWFDLTKPNYELENIILTTKYLTSNNISDIFSDLKIPNDFDLLGIDIDGNDYHIRKALRQYKPRVIIMEYNGCYSPHCDYIMPENNNYIWQGENDTTFGASLKSITKLNNEFGYDLVYCTSEGVNAFFIRKDINIFKCKEPDEVFKKVLWYNNELKIN